MDLFGKISFVSYNIDSGVHRNFLKISLWLSLLQNPFFHCGNPNETAFFVYNGIHTRNSLEQCSTTEILHSTVGLLLIAQISRQEKEKTYLS